MAPQAGETSQRSQRKPVTGSRFDTLRRGMVLVLDSRVRETRQDASGKADLPMQRPNLDLRLSAF